MNERLRLTTERRAGSVEAGKVGCSGPDAPWSDASAAVLVEDRSGLPSSAWGHSSCRPRPHSTAAALSAKRSLRSDLLPLARV